MALLQKSPHPTVEVLKIEGDLITNWCVVLLFEDFRTCLGFPNVCCRVTVVSKIEFHAFKIEYMHEFNKANQYWGFKPLPFLCVCIGEAVIWIWAIVVSFGSPYMKACFKNPPPTPESRLQNKILFSPFSWWPAVWILLILNLCKSYVLH